MLQHGSQHLTRSADLHLFFPIIANLTFAYCPINKPAQFAGLKFPGRTFLFLLRGTFFNQPARFSVFPVLFQSGNQEKHLPLNIGRDGSPALLVAVDGL